MKKTSLILMTFFVCVMLLCGCGASETFESHGYHSDGRSVSDKNGNSTEYEQNSDNCEDVFSETTVKLPEKQSLSFDINNIEPYLSSPYVSVNNNVPYFTTSDLTEKSFETYSELDSSGRCGVAYACLGKDLMPNGDRENIGSVKPSGWKTVKYDNVDGKYLYNRCHLIGFQLSGEQANRKNLITGTRSMNVNGMLPFENMIADYIKETNNHVMYRVTPVFEGNNLLATGVLMEAYSVEDKGEGICFNVFCYNEQPGIIINHATGDSSQKSSSDLPAVLDEASGNGEEISSEDSSSVSQNNYVLNTNTNKFHYPDCASAERIKPENRGEVVCSRDDIVARGYEPCKECFAK